MSDPDEDENTLRIPVVYIGTEDLPILYGNQFVIQMQRQEYFLSVGQVTPPILLGTQEQQRQQAKELSYVPVKVIARLAFNRDRLEQLAALLRKYLDEHPEGPQEPEE